MKCHNKARIVIGGMALAWMLVGCGAAQSPEGAIQDYLEAVVAKDGDKAASLSCADWESGAHSEVDALVAVSPILNGLSCSQSGTDGDNALVSCTGTIKVTYNGEQRELDLSTKTYIAAQEGGAWRMCGYAP